MSNMSSLHASSTYTKPLPKLRVECRANQTDQTPTNVPTIKLNRRDCLVSLVGIQSMAGMAQLASPAYAQDVPPPPQAPDVAPKWKVFIDRDFLFRYPSTFSIVEDLVERNGMPKEKPVKAEVRSQDGKQRVSVVVKQASAIKRALTTITDVTQFGDAEYVASIVLPAGTKVLASSMQAFPQPPKDTGSVLGVIERPPLNMYRYEAALPNGDYVDMAVGVIFGRLIVMAASSTGDSWEEAAPTVRAIAETFKLLTK